MSRSNPSAFGPRLILGLLLAVGGALALLSNFGLLELDFVAGWWTVAIAALGLLQLVFGDNRFAKALGLGLLLLGSALTAAKLNPDLLRPEEVWQAAWPLALVAVGGFVVYRALVPAPSRAGQADSASQVSIFVLLSGQERKVDSPTFAGGELTAIMGGYELDLRDADIPDGQEAVIDVLAVMGGGSIRVPPGWTVDARVTPFMGGVSVKTGGGATGAKLLRIRGLAVMGGVEVKS